MIVPMASRRAEKHAVALAITTALANVKKRQQGAHNEGEDDDGCHDGSNIEVSCCRLQLS